MTIEKFEKLELDIDAIARKYEVGYLMNLEDDDLTVKFEIKTKVPEDELDEFTSSANLNKRSSL